MIYLERQTYHSTKGYETCGRVEILLRQRTDIISTTFQASLVRAVFSGLNKTGPITKPSRWIVAQSPGIVPEMVGHMQ